MPKELDVYQLIKTYSARTKLGIIDYLAFSQAVQRQARNYDQNEPFFRDLSLHPDSILVPKLFQLSRDGKISLQAVQNRIDKIFFPEVFTQAVNNEYKRIENNPDIPFPDDDTLNISIPREWVQLVSVEADLPALLAQKSDSPVPIYRLIFPDGKKNMIILSVMLSGKLLEYSVLKIRNYLRKGSNKDYIQQRLAPAFIGKDSQLKNSLSSILIRPLESAEELRSSMGDFSYPFWAYLTTAIRKDLTGKGDLLPDDIAIIQASYIIDVYNNHYKNKAQREADKTDAFNNLNLAIKKEPFLFSIDDISEFRDSMGRPLLGKYSKEELEDWLRDRSTKAPSGYLPELLLLGSGHAKGHFIAKESLIPYLIKGLKENRSVIKAMITRDWKVILEDFKTVPAMDDDKAFAVDLDTRLADRAPFLSSILETSLPALVYQETNGGMEVSEDLERCFGSGKVAGTDVLLNLNRKQTLMDAKIMLPFWYSIPFISWIFKLFFRTSSKKSIEKQKKEAINSKVMREDPKPENTRALEFSQMARAAEKRLLPQGQSLEDRMISLNGRWNTMLDVQAKANLTEDIHSLVRDFVRNALRTMRPSSFTLERIETMAANIADRPNLLKIRNHQALEEYIKLYIIKLLKR